MTTKGYLESSLKFILVLWLASFFICLGFVDGLVRKKSLHIFEEGEIISQFNIYVLLLCRVKEVLIIFGD